MQELKRVFRSFVLVLSVFSLLDAYNSTARPAWTGIPQAQAQSVTDPEQDPGGEEVDGGGCSNTICLGVSTCRYQAYYQCSMTRTSCTNRLC